MPDDVPVSQNKGIVMDLEQSVSPETQDIQSKQASDNNTKDKAAG